MVCGSRVAWVKRGVAALALLWATVSAIGQIGSESLGDLPADGATAGLEGEGEGLDSLPGLDGKRSVSRGIPIRRRSTLGGADPLYRNGVGYYDEWTIRAGAMLLRLPAYEGWQGVSPQSSYYDYHANTGEPGNHLAAILTNNRFMRESRSKYVNFYALIWVPQRYAFLEMTLPSFAVFKNGVHDRLVEERKATVERDEFWTFDDYMNFRTGLDEEVERSIDGQLIRVEDTPDLVTYFATSEFIFQTPKTEIRQPMIMSVTYALVRGKLLRIDFQRLSTRDEDVAQLLALSRRFVEDMRLVNGLGERRLR